MCSLTLEMTFSERWLRATLSRVGVDCSKLPALCYLVSFATSQTSQAYALWPQKRNSVTLSTGQAAFGVLALTPGTRLQQRFHHQKNSEVQDSEKLDTILYKKESGDVLLEEKNEENIVTIPRWPKVHHKEKGFTLVEFLIRQVL